MSVKIRYKRVLEGFTLFELLVVMAVIGILATVSIFGLQGARESARDATRKLDLETIASGLELYKADCKAYPIGNDNFYAVAGPSFADNDGGASACGSGANVYIKEVSQDSISGQNYYYTSTGGSYTLCAGLETDTTLDPVCSTAGADCGSATCSYHVVSP